MNDQTTSITLNDLSNGATTENSPTSIIAPNTTSMTDSTIGANVVPSTSYVNMNDFKPIAISEIAPIKESISLSEAATNDLIGDLDIALDRTKGEMLAIAENGKELIRQRIIEAQEAQEDKELGSSNSTQVDNDDAYDDDSDDNSATVNFLDPDTADLEEAIEDELTIAADAEEEDAKKKRIMADFKESVQAVIKPIKNKLDLSKFTIRNKPIAISKVLGNSSDVRHVSDWALFNTNRSISVSEFTGIEIEKLNTSTRSRNRLNAMQAMYSTIYAHVIDANKPATMEEWVKGISFFDIEHLFFAVYKACFENSNYIPYVCQKNGCNKAFVKSYDIEQLVKFKTPEAKTAFYKILEKDSTSVGTFDSQLIQVSDEYAISVKVPSIYNVAFETAVLDDAFRTKYAELLSVISFIEAIYTINADTNELAPISTDPIPEDLLKSTKRKVRNYSRILSKLKSDEYAILKDAVAELSKRDDGITYVYPATECPACHTKIDETAEDPLIMVFTRHQLTTIANS